MRRTNSKAGGFFIAVGALAGFGFGLAAGDPFGYAVIGTAIGIAIAFLVWLVDRWYH